MAATNTGTSATFTISAEDVSAVHHQFVKAVDIAGVKPPDVSENGSASLAITKWINPWPEFVFDSISTAKFDGIAWYIAMPRNEPVAIKDYHYIGLMRAIDIYLAPTYSGYIYCESSGGPSSGGP